MALARLEDISEYEEGRPIGFVYQETNHPPSYQIREKGKVPTGGRSDLAEFAEIARSIEGVVWLTQEQIAVLGNMDMRPLSQEELAQIAA
jgi:hypothetical protein